MRSLRPYHPPARFPVSPVVTFHVSPIGFFIKSCDFIDGLVIRTNLNLLRGVFELSAVDEVTSRSLAVLGRYWMCLEFAVRPDLEEILKAVCADEYEALKKNAGEDKEESLAPPLVLFSEDVGIPEASKYQERMGRLDLASRVALLRLTLQDLSTLTYQELITFDEAERYRKLTHEDLGDTTVYDISSYLNDLVLVRMISEVTASCYRRWVSSHLEQAGFSNASDLRSWVIPYSRKFFVLLFGFLEHRAASEAEEREQELKVGSFTLSGLRQLDLFEAPTNMELPANSPATDKTFEGVAQMFDAKELEKQQELSKRKTGEYTYISGTVLPVLLSELLAKNKKGDAFRYKHGEITAALFQCSLFTGLRHVEWFDAILHEDGYTDSKVTDLTLSAPVLQVFSVKQGNRRADNPLRDYRLLVLDKFSEDHVAVIRNTLLVIQDMAKTQSRDAIIRNIRMQLNRVWKKLVREGRVKETNQRSEGVTHNSVSMHTARKTFAEEVRRSLEYTRYELAAMLGHTTLLNMRFYAKAAKMLPRTHDFPLPRPWPGDAVELEEWSEAITGYLSGGELTERMRQLSAPGGRSGAKDWDETLSY